MVRFKCYFNVNMLKLGSNITMVHFGFSNKKKSGRMGLQLVIQGTIEKPSTGSV